MNTLPQIQIDSLRKLVDDGCHNGFTDMCRFRGEFHLAYRSSATGHGIWPDSRVVVLRSADGNQWEQSFTYSVPKRDVRDPHFMVLGDRLFAYSATWLCDPVRPQNEYELSTHLGYAIWTDDGKRWHGPQALDATYGYYIWRAIAHNGKAYLGGRGGHPPGPMQRWRKEYLFESNDGLTWRKPDVAFHETDGSETAYLVETDGTMLALSRALKDAYICRAKPPYSTWTRTPLHRFVGGPMLARWGEHILVGGRKRLPDGTARTVLSWLVDDQLVDALELPSGGDNSYTGFVAISDAQGLLSYYSSHEGSGTMDAPAHIYLAKISIGSDRR